MSCTCGRTCWANSVRMRIISLRSSPSSSRILLFASTTSVGSMKTVLPEADSSWTIPLIFLFMPGNTGITNLPSRMAGVTSFSTSPSLCAARSILYKVRDMLPSVLLSSCRILASSVEAESLILPNLSRIWSIRWISCGNVITSSVNRCRAG